MVNLFREAIRMDKQLKKKKSDDAFLEIIPPISTKFSSKGLKEISIFVNLFFFKFCKVYKLTNPIFT